MPASDDALSPYRAKRSADRTPEPFDSRASSTGNLFVVQHHAARRVHFDFRIERGGVLWSWAIPKGPSPNPADKRLAVQTEDHPVDYAEFEGRIPEGNYGAGAVIVWDRGTWVPLADPEEGLAKGKLLFELRGYKLRGKWTLVKTRRGPKDWLFIKEKDGWARDESDAEFPQDSVYSGLTVEQLKTGERKTPSLRRRLSRYGAHKSRVRAKDIKVMLATSESKPFSRAGWLFEVKFDGYRLITEKEADTVKLWSRAGKNLTATFPELEKAVSALPYEHLIIDGEAVVHNEHGLPSFARLAKRGRLTRPVEIRRAASALPASLYVFDLLAFDDYDLRQLALKKRKTLLKDVLPSAGPVRYSDHIEKDGDTVYEHVCAMRLEGVVAKRADSTYRSGRSPDWVKITAQKSDDFVIVGYTTGKGNAKVLGALHLAQHLGSGLRYCGRVGSGFSDDQRGSLDAFSPLERSAAPCEVPSDATGRWLAPELVCEVRYKQRTEAGVLRQPVFLRFRDDKGPKECTHPDDLGVIPEPTAEVETTDGQREVRFTNRNKVFWPDEHYTKGDLIDYYASISRWLLPYLRNRPVVLTRYPDGIDGKSFFQKDAPEFVPKWIRLERIWSQGSAREVRYFIVEDEASLLYLVNLGTIPLHVWSSRIQHLERPDWCILDLDPKGAPFAHVVNVAKAIHTLCKKLELPCFAKTSGSTGLHVLVPLGATLTHEQSRTLAELLSRVVAKELREIATVTRALGQRSGRVYIDYGQNGHGRLLVAPFSVRPLPGAPVAMPLNWSEVNGRLRLDKFTIRTAARRMRALKTDPLAPVLDLRPELQQALVRLGKYLEG